MEPNSNNPTPLPMAPGIQLYGGGAYDGSPNMANMTAGSNGAQWFQGENDYGDFDQDANGEDGNADHDAEGGDQRDPKRRRIARACDMCRRKKIKCDG